MNFLCVRVSPPKFVFYAVYVVSKKVGDYFLRELFVTLCLDA
jgi:hypothetical protein